MVPVLQVLFGGRGAAGPRVIMTDDSTSERNALGAVWPEARLLLCIFHVLQAAWRWLFSQKNGIRQQVNVCLSFNVMINYGPSVQNQRCDAEAVNSTSCMELGTLKHDSASRSRQYGPVPVLKEI